MPKLILESGVLSVTQSPPQHSALWAAGPLQNQRAAAAAFYQMCSDARGFGKRGKGRRKEGEVKGKDKKNQYHDGAFCDSVCSTY